MLTRRTILTALVTLAFLPRSAWAGRSAIASEPWAKKLIDAAKSQVGVTLSYDPNYRKISYPGGDVAREVGVCTDVIIRAYRDALSIDLQEQVHSDMKQNFASYPAIWGLAATDSNIDHRRVPNLRTFFKRKGAQKPAAQSAFDYLPGDIVTQNLPGNLAHIVLVSDELNSDQSRPLVIHNIGAGAKIEDTLLTYEITGHYRYEG